MRTTTQGTLILGEIGAREVRLGASTLRSSVEHARRLAIELGTLDYESSVAAYWAFGSRVRQWQQLIGRIGHEPAHELRFVEIGSGMGLFTLLGQALDYTIIGVESSSDRYETSLQTAQQLFADNRLTPSLAQAPSEALPFLENSVDVVVSFQTFEHVANLPHTLAEIHRILKPGGFLFAQVPNYNSLYEAHYGIFFPLAGGKATTRRYLRLLRKPTGFLEHLQWLTPASVGQLLHKTGFSSVEVGRPGKYLPSHTRWSSVAHPVPFRFRRGLTARSIAFGLARLAAASRISRDIYPQIEIWATRP